MTADTGLPQGWEVRWSNTRKLPYYYMDNGAQSESLWKHPAGTNEKKLRRYLDQRIQASHLLIKNKESRRPSSWREPNITRSKEEAREILEQHRANIVDKDSGITLPALAEVESDCSSASKSGVLGEFGFGEMQMPFWHASVKLVKNEVSDIVETASGLHLIQRWNDDPPEEEDETEVGPAQPSPLQ